MAKKQPDTTPTTPPLVERFLAARRASTPIVWLATPDPAATIAGIQTALEARASVPVPLARWDCVTGIRPLNEAAAMPVRQMGGDQQTHFVDATLALATSKWPAQGIAFMLNAHLAVADHTGASNPGGIQAAWNTRDLFKCDRRMLVLVAPHTRVPDEIRHDVVVLDEPLPGVDELGAIVARQYESANMPAPDAEVLERAVDRLTGLAAFSAEQVTAMSLTPNGVDLDALESEQARLVNATPGLVVHRATADDDAGLMHGCDNVLGFARRLFAGTFAPRAIVWVDEIEKAFGGLLGDTSGTTQDQLGVVLQEMQDLQADGLLLVGHPGTGKSMAAKAIARRHQRPLVRLDLGAAKDSLVGSSEQRVRAVFKTIRAVSAGRVLVVATSNGLGVLPPELRRRFRLGTFMFELPASAERDALLTTYAKHHGLKPSQASKDRTLFSEWTGAEIATACALAARLSCTVDEAAAYVVPVAQSMPERIVALRREAHRRYLDANKPGVFVAPGEQSAAPVAVVPMGRAARVYGES